MFFKKNWASIFMFSALLLLLIMFLFRQFAMLNSSETCGTIIREFTIKGNRTFVVGFNIQNEKKTGKVSSQAFKVKDLKDLKKYDCIKIKYSNSFPSYIEIVDERLRAGSGW